jgi:hypothetical protein
MDLDQKERDIVYIWGQITSISRMERVDKMQNKEQVRFYLRTLDKMEIILESTDWENMSITKEQSIYYIQIFHSAFNNTILG